MRYLLRSFSRDTSGATAIEYGLIAGFLAICLVAALPSVTSGLSDRFGAIGTTLTSH